MYIIPKRIKCILIGHLWIPLKGVCVRCGKRDKLFALARWGQGDECNGISNSNLPFSAADSDKRSGEERVK